MSYRYVYPNRATVVGAAPGSGYNVDPGLMSAGYPNGMPADMYDDRRQRSYSPGSFSSDSESTDDYEYRGRMITREARCPRDVVRAPTPPPIIKRVVERAPTPEAPVMERVIIRPQAQEIVERVIEQPRTPPPRIIQKEMQEEAPPPIVRTRVIKVDRPLCNAYSQPGSPYNPSYNGLPSCSNGVMGGNNPYRTHSILASVGRPVGFHHPVDHNPSFSSASSFDYAPPMSMATTVPQTTMMMMPSSQQVQPMGVMQQQQLQHQVQPIGVMQQQQQQQPGQPMGVMQPQPVQQLVYRPVQIQPSVQHMAPQSMQRLSSNYIPSHYMYSGHQGMSLGYRPMMQPGRMIPSGMPMMTAGNTFVPSANHFPNQPQMFNPITQQLVY
ncbi:unnamed protein product [Rotaria sordida]|uniref:Uncharacterized protein n=1 Tax=Rotaria sordida TaxID=392033 RepID=A0A816F0E9_9BILA|nr:unnamed protein product [Rotaria sordida]CAF0948028.1 unnamed protein product [Rotaria sordida]CAF1395190.1 unnamed protein product [Rotaria sordida]CAF1500178.1 unnamed protein product [Rotaria sordida]CAF1654835.1 unnamed protein product [Rotaria sordida]